MYKPKRKKTPIMTGNEYGNGIIKEIAILIARDIPIHNTWFRITFLLLKLIINYFIICILFIN
jgi:hypothetical protein